MMYNTEKEFNGKIHNFDSKATNNTLKIFQHTDNRISLVYVVRQECELTVVLHNDSELQPFKLEQNFFGIKNTDNLEKIEKFLMVLNRYESLNSDVFEKIKIDLKQKFTETTLECIHKKDYQEAIDKAIYYQNYNFYFPVWMVVISWQDSKLSSNQLVDFCKAVSEKNPYYLKANAYTYQFLAKNQEANENNFLEQFKCAYNSRDQKLIDDAFNKLCGYSTVVLRDMKGDRETLIACAQAISKANKENSELKQQLSGSQKQTASSAGNNRARIFSSKSDMELRPSKKPKTEKSKSISSSSISSSSISSSSDSNSDFDAVSSDEKPPSSISFNK